MPKLQTVNVDAVGRLPAFSHAKVAGGWIFVSGTLGTKPESFALVEGGVGPETTQALENVGQILSGAGACFADVAKMNVYLTDMAGFGEMNQAYLAFFESDPPARITVGCAGLALGAAVEIDCIAVRS
ncbi:MAG: RidA family protein [Myxococcota bacterium]|nr:RidA family protein [Myxococcota bacterium]